MSKVLKAIELYNSMVADGTISNDRKDRANRAPVLKAFQDVLGLSAAGASTYYGNIQRELKGWTLETRKTKEVVAEVVVDHLTPAVEAVNAMSTKDLVELYNISQSTSIKKFRDRATAVAKVLATYGDNLPQVLSA